MSYAIQWGRSLIFICLMYITMPLVGLVYLPWAIVSRDGAMAGCHAYCRLVRWLARWIIGLHTEVRGTPPTGEVMIAAKHQSFMDVLVIFGAVPQGKFIMKSILKYAPVIGWFGLRIGCVPVDRGKRGQAIKKMLAEVKAGRDVPGQLIIYPQGTRIAPGVSAKYKLGTSALYQELGQPVIPVSCNVGVFWPKRGIYRKPGNAVIEFHEPVPVGLSTQEFMKKIETVIETGSNALAAEAGFKRVTEG
jgi:1-acyl-sn-glycerol-3-phosphate acyltransferase